MISSSNLSFDDLNHDGNVDWNEIFIVWALPSGKQWWKYILGASFSAWAILILYKVWQYDKVLSAKQDIESPKDK